MADTTRIHIWHYVLNEGGQPIQNAEIRLYLQDAPTTEAEIYTSEHAASSTTCSDADIKTDNDGYFEFWLAGESESGGYAHTQEFILEWFKAGIAPGYVYNYNPWPNALVWRDKNTGADRTYENKFVSDYLAKKWWDHAYATVPSGAIPYEAPHDLHPVDFTSGCDDNTYNKVVSNKFLYDILQGCYASDTEEITYEGVTEYSQNVTSWTASSGVYYIDINHTNVGNDTKVVLIDTDTSKEVVPKKIQHTSTNVTRIFVAEDINVRISFQGYSASSSSSSLSSSSLSSSSSSSLSSSSSSLSSSSSSISSSSASSIQFTLSYDTGGAVTGTAIAFSPSAGGVDGRYVVVDGAGGNVKYSDDAGETWTSYVNPSGAMYNVRWIPQLNGFISVYQHAIGFSSDGLSFTKSNECAAADYVDDSNINYSQRTGLVWVVSQQGGSTTKVHTSSDGLTLNVLVDYLGLYNQSYGGCSHLLKDFFFSANYTVAQQCIAPDTLLNSWETASQTPFSVIATSTPRARLLSNGVDTMAYSRCYNYNENGWALNEGISPSGSFTWQNGQYGYGKFWVLGYDDHTLRYSDDGITFIDTGVDLSGMSNNERDCAPGIGKVITIGSGGDGLCRIVTITEV